MLAGGVYLMNAVAGVYRVLGKPMQKVAKQNVSQDIGVPKATQSIFLVIVCTSTCLLAVENAE